METKSTNRKIQWIPILLIIWNILDIGVHIAVDLVEPLRIAGNIVGLVGAGIVLLGLLKPYQHYLLGLAVVAVIILNAVESALHGFLVPMLIFVGVSILLLLLMTQSAFSKANPQSTNEKRPLYLRWWMSIPATLVGIAIVALVGEPGQLPIAPLTQLHNGQLVAADYWGDEPMILSAGMGFENIIGLPEITEEIVREAGGSWYGSVTCTNGEEPDDAAFTSAAPSEGIARLFKGYSEFDDGLPIVFSWPVATEKERTTVEFTSHDFVSS